MASGPVAQITPIYQYHRELSDEKDMLYFFSTIGNLGGWWILDKIVWYGSSTPFPGMSAVYQFAQLLPDGSATQSYFSLDATPPPGWEFVQIAWYSITLNPFTEPIQVYQYQKPIENSNVNQYFYTTNSNFGGGWKNLGPIFAGPTTSSFISVNGVVTSDPSDHCWEFTPFGGDPIYIDPATTGFQVGEPVAILAYGSKHRDCPGPAYSLGSIESISATTT